MSVLSEARSALNNLAKRFEQRAGFVANQDSDINKAIGALNSAETELKSVRGRLTKAVEDTKNDISALQALVAATQINDRHSGMANSQQAQKKAEDAAAALGGLDEKIRELRAAVGEAKTKVAAAKTSMAMAKTAISKTAGSL